MLPRLLLLLLLLGISSHTPHFPPHPFPPSRLPFPPFVVFNCCVLVQFIDPAFLAEVIALSAHRVGDYKVLKDAQASAAATAAAAGAKKGAAAAASSASARRKSTSR
jgi:hypothetical protein